MSESANSSEAGKIDEPMEVAVGVTDIEKIRSLPWQFGYGVGSSVFSITTIFGSVFVLFLNELGIDKTRIGILLSFIPFCGILALFTAPILARIGFKRAMFTCYGLRKLVVALLILTPIVMDRFGEGTGFAWVAGVVGVFAVFRSLAETASASWWQELVPNHMRGKVNGLIGIVCTLTSIGAVLGASYIVGHFGGMVRFQIIFAGGVIIGLCGVICILRFPGGRPIVKKATDRTHVEDMLEALGDRNFMKFLGGLGIVAFSCGLMLPFVPLFMKEQIGLTAEKVVFLESWYLGGTLLTCYLWGWSSDRYGSKPMMLLGALILTLLPVCWFLLPANHSLSFYLAMGIAFLLGIGTTGWNIGRGRYYYNSAMPPEKKTAYSAIWYAWISVSAAAGPLIGGRFLDWTSSVSFNLWMFEIGSYRLLFAISFTLLIVGIILLRRLKADSKMSAGRFVSMFFQGNPLMAFSSLVRFHLAKDESDRADSMARMGRARNPLNIEELIQSLEDPSFNVRYEAIISIAHMPAHPELIDALLKVLGSDQADLSVNAAWALGKLGDKSAIVPLREMLVSEYPLLRARCGRALAMLGDNDSENYLLQGMDNETNQGVRLAYAAALGQLGSRKALPKLLTYLRELVDDSSISEMALGIGRIVGQEGRYIRLWRDMDNDMATYGAQAVHYITKEITQRNSKCALLGDNFEDCAGAFARGDCERAINQLIEIAGKLPADSFSQTATTVIKECISGLGKFNEKRKIYLVLILHTMISECRTGNQGNDIK